MYDITLYVLLLLTQVYATKFSEDEDWYRCRLVKYVSESKVNIFSMQYTRCLSLTMACKLAGNMVLQSLVPYI